MKNFSQFLAEEDKVTKSGGYLAYILSESSREHLLKLFPPKYEKIICEHVTWKFPAKIGDAFPPPVREAHVIGYQSEEGIEALAVEINGEKQQVGGRPLHITLSLDPSKRKAKDSGPMLEKGYKHVTPILIQLEPKQLS